MKKASGAALPLLISIYGHRRTNVSDGTTRRRTLMINPIFGFTGSVFFKTRSSAGTPFFIRWMRLHNWEFRQITHRLSPVLRLSACNAPADGFTNFHLFRRCPVLCPSAIKRDGRKRRQSAKAAKGDSSARDHCHFALLRVVSRLYW